MLNQALSKSNFGKSNSLSEQSVAESKLNICNLPGIEELSEEESAMVMGGRILSRFAAQIVKSRFTDRIARSLAHLG